MEKLFVISGKSAPAPAAYHPYPAYAQYPAESLYYPPMGGAHFVPYPYSVPQVPMGVHPQNQSSEETQGEYYYGTWYPTSGKDTDVNESNDLSEGIKFQKKIFSLKVETISSIKAFLEVGKK